MKLVRVERALGHVTKAAKVYQDDKVFQWLYGGEAGWFFIFPSKGNERFHRVEIWIEV